MRAFHICRSEGWKACFCSIPALDDGYKIGEEIITALQSLATGSARPALQAEFVLKQHDIVHQRHNNGKDIQHVQRHDSIAGGYFSRFWQCRNGKGTRGSAWQSRRPGIRAHE